MADQCDDETVVYMSGHFHFPLEYLSSKYQELELRAKVGLVDKNKVWQEQKSHDRNRK